MSDLERVRDYIGKYAPNPTKAMHVLEDLDAHLKEDATNRKRYRAQEIEANTRRNKAEAERDRLREEKRRWIVDGGHDGSCIEVKAEALRQRDTLLAALRAALTVCEELENEVTALGGYVPLNGRSGVAVAYQSARAAIAEVEGSS